MAYENIKVNDKDYSIIRLLGKGKGGYSYLASRENNFFVLKQIHHEPCSYYHFGDKLQAELHDYERLRETGISIPRLIDWDVDNERILKEYIEGETIFELICRDKMQPEYLSQLKQMCKQVYAAGLNIDYFPTNFVVQQGRMFYIDFECNPYSEEWNFENWGIKYWSKTPEFLQYVNDQNQQGGKK